MKRKTGIAILLLVVLSTILVSCGGPEQKKMKFYNKGKALYEKGEFVKARLEFRNAIQIDPKFADAYYMLGMTMSKAGNLREAYGSLSKAVDLKPDHMKAQVALARVLIQGRAPDMALEKAELVLKAEPQNQDAAVVKAEAVLLQKESDKAISLLNQLIAKGVKPDEVYLALTAAYNQKGDAKRAEQTLRDGIAANPKSLGLNGALADFYAKNKRFDDAIIVAKRMIALDANNLGYKLALGEVYWKAVNRIRQGSY